MSRETLPLALVLALIVVALYVGAYYAMVTPMLTPTATAPVIVGAPWITTQVVATEWEPNYRGATPLFRVLFRPVHAVDRRLRPQAFWHMPPPGPVPIRAYLCPTHPPTAGSAADT